MTRRQHRYNRLKEFGFFPFEARQLCKVPFKTPYMREGIRERKRALKDAQLEYKERKLRFSKTEWAEIIKEMYITRNWLKEGRSDPWQMLRAWEDRYRDKRPEYESPPKHRKPKIKRQEDFVSKYAKSLVDYEKGRGR